MKYDSVDVKTDSVSRTIDLGSERKTFLDEIQGRSKATNQMNLNNELGCCDKLLTKLVKFAKESEPYNHTGASNGQIKQAGRHEQ